jgi:hypothetical protein
MNTEKGVKRNTSEYKLDPYLIYVTKITTNLRKKLDLETS